MAEGKATPSQRVPLWIKAGYGGGLFGLGLVQIGVSALLLYFYTDVLIIPPHQAAILMFVGGVADSVANLLAAWATTRANSRLGRYRPFLIYGAAPLGIAFAAMFLETGLSGSWLFAYALVTHVIYRFAYAFIAVPHASLITRMSADADERTSIGGVKAIAGGLGTFAAGFIGLNVVRALGGADEALGFMAFALIFGTGSAIAVALSGWITKETVKTPALAIETPSILSAMALIVRNGQLLVILAANWLFFSGYVFLFGGVIYYFKYVLDDQTGAPTAIAAIAAGSVLSPPLWVALARRTSKAVSWSAGCALIVAAFSLLYVSPAAPMGALMIFYAMLGAGKSSALMNYFAMVADAVDYGQWRTGRRAEAYSFGFLSLSSKMGLATGGALMGLGLAWAGLQANIDQSAETIGRIAVVTCLLPAVIIAISGVLISFFRVDRKRHMTIMAELAARQGVEPGQ